MMAAQRKTANTRPGAARGQTDLVFGLGATGLSVARYLKRVGRKARYIDTRSKPPGLGELQKIDASAEVVVGRTPLEALSGVGRIIVSPGVPNREPLLDTARDAGIEIVSDIELFVRELRAPFAAVTGSNGKSTVTTLIGLMCEAAGRKVQVGGNLGDPALDLLERGDADLYVLELSSFQLVRTRNLPAAVAVLLNISPDHLDWHGSEAEYRAAKYRIFREARSVVTNRDDPEAERHVPATAARVTFGLDKPTHGQYGIVIDEGVPYLARGRQLLLATTDMALVGAHNHANALAALAAGQLLGLDHASMLQVLTEFPGLPHRMQFVARKGGVNYINDSKATNVGAAVASVRSIDGRVVLIAGGDGKGADFDAFVREVAGKLRAAILLGRDGPALAAAFKGHAPVYQVADMRTAVSAAGTVAEEGDTVLLAPACASLDQYQNYAERGRDFVGAVQEMLP